LGRLAPSGYRCVWPSKSFSTTHKMNIAIRKSGARGQADHGWLKSRFSFSFSEYYDPAHMGFRCLRVINEDWISPGGGFPTHPHRDMEIFTVLLEGTLEHRDSLGNGQQIKPGEIQLMTAGSGITHSEFNPSATEAAHLLQIWILPRARNLTPGYTDWKPSASLVDGFKSLIISSYGREGSATIQQDVRIYRLSLPTGKGVTHAVEGGRAVWLQCMRGSGNCMEVPFSQGDGVHTEDAGTLFIEATSATPLDALLFDLP
jgi:redox-sensitive bicupin YhaK (pirin superfamily)